MSIPLVEPVPPPDGGAALWAAVRQLEHYDWLVVTSANGSRSVVEALKGVDVPKPRVGAVGAATARELLTAGWKVALQASVSSAQGLVDRFPAATPGQKILAPLAVLASNTVVDGLRTKGYVVDRVDAYATEASVITPSQRASLDDATAILFTSSSTVDRFVDAVGMDLVPKLRVSIGPQTTATMVRLGLEPSVTALEHTQEGVVRALVSLV